MKILFLGDVVGRSGRKAVCSLVPKLRKKLNLDFVIVNGENVAHGFGITGRLAKEFFEAGADVITTGDHIWNQKDAKVYIDSERRLLRPINLDNEKLGNGAEVFETAKGKKVLVVNVLGKLFVEDKSRKPHVILSLFKEIDKVLKQYKLKQNVDAIFIDLHGEATSEKMAFTHYVDGLVSAVIGTHTHVPTADWRIFPKGTLYQTDAGMCGDYNSVIGMKKEGSLGLFLGKNGMSRLEPADAEADICGVICEIDDKTGLGRKIEPVRIGPNLSKTHSVK